MTNREKLYDKIENLNNNDYLNFIGEWFGVDNLFDMLRHSIESADDETIRIGLNMLK